MRRAVVAALLAGLCSAGMTACSDDPSPDPPATSSSTTSATTPTTPTSTSPTEPAPPKLPALAKENSQAGAKAFIRYYADLINYAWAAGDTDLLRSVASKQCKGCLAAADGVDEVIAAGGYRRGADWSPRSFFVVPLQPATEPIVNVAIHVSNGDFRESSTSAPRAIHSAINRFDFHLRRETGSWKITRLVAA